MADKAHTGDPGRRSPQDVSKSSAYETMNGYSQEAYFPSAAAIVVKHKKTQTYWRAVYSVRDDDSDFGWPATWEQVEPEQITITKYKTKAAP